MTQIRRNVANSVTIPFQNILLNGFLHVPENATGLVIFVHGSGSSRFSTRNQQTASILNKGNLATLLFDLLTTDEDAIDSVTREYRFNIDFLSTRLVEVTNWCKQQEILQDINIGYFGASTGGGAALVASTKLSFIKAIVSRGGRPDLANESLSKVTAPTLLIVGGNDVPVIEMNESALLSLNCIKELKIIPGATHLFEEPGALDKVSVLAQEWFLRYL